MSNVKYQMTGRHRIKIDKLGNEIKIYETKVVTEFKCKTCSGVKRNGSAYCQKCSDKYHRNRLDVVHIPDNSNVAMIEPGPVVERKSGLFSRLMDWLKRAYARAFGSHAS